MLTFAVAVSRSGRGVSDAVIAWLRDRTCIDVPYEARTHDVWSNEDGTVWFAGWQDVAEEGAAAQQRHVDADGLTAFTGRLWPRLGEWSGTRPRAAQLAARLRTTPLTAGGDDLAGIYGVASLCARGGGSVAADPLGIGLLYWGHGDDVIAISSRASLAAGLLAAERGVAPSRDTIGSGWLAYSIHPMGTQTGFEAVSVVPEGALVSIGPTGGAQLVHPRTSPWRLDAPDSTAPEDLLEEARLEMHTAIRNAFLSPATRCANLTGGKDSRLVLALLLEDGSAGDVQFETSGEADLPDVIVARAIARSLGLHHVENAGKTRLLAWRRAVDSAVRGAGDPSISSREIGQRITAWICSGGRNVAKTHLPRPPAGDRVLLSGFFGETLRTNYPGSSRLRTKTEAASFPEQQHFGSASILRPEVHAHYRREMHRLLFEGCREDESPQDVVDAFYLRNRVRRWFGTEHEIDTDDRVFPLYSITGIRLAFAIGAENRHAEWIHYQLIREAFEPLLHMDFASGAWPEDAGRDLMEPRRHRESVPAAPASTGGRTGRRSGSPGGKGRGRASGPLARTVGEERRARGEALDLEIMRGHLTDPSNPVFELVDPGATRRALDRFTGLPQPQKLQLYGAQSAAIWLGGHEIPLPRVDPAARP